MYVFLLFWLDFGIFFFLKESFFWVLGGFIKFIFFMVLFVFYKFKKYFVNWCWSIFFVEVFLSVIINLYFIICVVRIFEVLIRVFVFLLKMYGYLYLLNLYVCKLYKFGDVRSVMYVKLVVLVFGFFKKVLYFRVFLDIGFFGVIVDWRYE